MKKEIIIVFTRIWYATGTIIMIAAGYFVGAIMNDKKKEKKKQIERKALQGAAVETIQRFGSAAKEHLVAYDGKDYENGKELKRSLEAINKYKVHPDYEYANKKQQAGFSAEVKVSARENAEAILNGETKRVVRTDDIEGHFNDQLADIVEVDAAGNIIGSTRRQLKFIGENGKECVKGLLNKDFDKYREKNVPIEIPENYFDEAQKDLDERIKKLQEQIRSCEAAGKSDSAKSKRVELERVRKTKKLLRKSNVTSYEALEARNNPKLSVAKDVAKLAHRAGVQQAKMGAVISGSISIVKNVVACAKGEKKPEVAALDIAKDTGKGAAFSYLTSFSGTVVKGVMQHSSSEYWRALSHTGLSAGLVSCTMNVGKVVKQYICGQISIAECIERLGEQGFGEISAAMYATITVSAVQGANSVALSALAGIAGSTFGYAAATAVYQELKTSLKEYELAREERRRVEIECEEAVKLICQYREEMSQQISHYLSEHLETFALGFKRMDQAILDNDIDGFISGNTEIQRRLGHEVQFSNAKEFEELMLDDELALKL